MKRSNTERLSIAANSLAIAGFIVGLLIDLSSAGGLTAVLGRLVIAQSLLILVWVTAESAVATCRAERAVDREGIRVDAVSPAPLSARAVMRIRFQCRLAWRQLLVTGTLTTATAAYALEGVGPGGPSLSAFAAMVTWCKVRQPRDRATRALGDKRLVDPDRLSILAERPRLKSFLFGADGAVGASAAAYSLLLLAGLSWVLTSVIYDPRTEAGRAAEWLSGSGGELREHTSGTSAGFEPRQPSGQLAAPPTGVAVWTVQEGENFWSIAKTNLARKLDRVPSEAETFDYWILLVSANEDVLRVPDNPHLLVPGQVLILPD